MNRKERLNTFFTGMETMHRMMFHMHGAQKHPHGMTRAQLGGLFFLVHNERAGVKEMAEAFGATPSAVTQIVNGLVDAGFVDRKNDPEDRRKVHLSLTKKGKSVVQKAKEARQKRLGNLLSVLSDAELSQLNEIQKKLIEHLKGYETKS